MIIIITIAIVTSITVYLLISKNTEQHNKHKNIQND
jgi:hypothetical protein